MSRAAAVKNLYNPVGGSATRRGDDTLVAFTSLTATARDQSVVGGLAFDVVDGAVASTATLPAEPGSEGTQNAYRFVPWESIAGESDASPFLDAVGAPGPLDVTDESRLAEGDESRLALAGEWRVYKHAAAVGAREAGLAASAAAAVLGPSAPVVNLGCDGRKASVDLLPHGPQLHWVEAPRVADADAVADAFHASAGGRDVATFDSTFHDKVQLFAPDLGPLLGALGATPTLKRRSDAWAHASFDVAGQLYELVGRQRGKQPLVAVKPEEQP